MCCRPLFCFDKSTKTQGITNVNPQQMFPTSPPRKPLVAYRLPKNNTMTTGNGNLPSSILFTKNKWPWRRPQAPWPSMSWLSAPSRCHCPKTPLRTAVNSEGR